MIARGSEVMGKRQRLPSLQMLTLSGSSEGGVPSEGAMS